MPSLEERVAYLEGRFSEHMHTVVTLRDDVALLRADMNRRFEQIDKRFEQVDQRFDRLDSRFDRSEQRTDSLEDKFDRRFTWLVGVQMGGFIAVFSALIGLYFK